jgi:DNA segregation ATPase FtsK/SpoIIIE-like protein
MLTYINDESKRRATLTQLNRGESRHSLARAVFHGKRGELRQRYREGQEDQLGTLGLVVNMIVLWNTIYMTEALKQLKRQGYQILDDLVNQAISIIVQTNNASTAFLQRKLKLGFPRAARIMDEIEEMGIIGPQEGSKARKINITKEEWAEMQARR